MERREERRLGTLLVDRAAADDRLAEARLVDQARFERRRGPLRGIELLHVVHEVEADRLLRAGVECGEDARLAVGVEHDRLLEPGVACELRHVLGACRVVAVLGGDRGERDPLLQALHRLVVAFRDLVSDVGEVVGEGVRGGEEDECRDGGGDAFALHEGGC
jgi:hypothetical protein